MENMFGGLTEQSFSSGKRPKKKSTKNLVIGGTNIDNHLSIAGVSEHTAEGKLSFDLGSKNMVESAELHLGGNAANVAIGLARLGKHATLYTYLGEDAYTNHIENMLKNELVTLRAEMAPVPNDVSTILETPVDRVIFSQKEKRKRGFNLDINDEEKPEYIYLTAIGEPWEEAYSKITTYAKEHAVPLAISPGSAQLRNKNDILYAAIEASETFFCNKEEAMAILEGKGVKPETDDIKDILLTLKELGPQIISVSDGAEGSYLLCDDEKIYKIKPFGKNIVDTTGAGDAYATGLLSGIFEGKSPQDAMRTGAINAYSVMQSVGANEGLLTKEEMEDRLNQHEYFQPELLSDGKTSVKQVFPLTFKIPTQYANVLVT